jgi:hypothetical protein
VRGNGFAPTIAARAELGVSGFMNAAFGFLLAAAFFGAAALVAFFAAAFFGAAALVAFLGAAFFVAFFAFAI